MVDKLKVVQKLKREHGHNVEKRLCEVIDLLECERVVNIMIVAVDENGDVISSFANTQKPFALIGGLETTKAEFINCSIEDVHE